MILPLPVLTGKASVLICGSVTSKSALRQGERMLSYGEPQGESDFREVLADYIRERRNVICSPDDIVVGAGLQPLLQILCPLIHERKTVSFPTPSFTTCSTIFQDYGFDVHYRDKSCDVIYVSPAHMTKWGEIMPVKRRLELIRHAEINDHLIIEDDFENEFVYFQKPTPSLFGLAGGENVVYIGSFSRLLLPSHPCQLHGTATLSPGKIYKKSSLL